MKNRDIFCTINIVLHRHNQQTMIVAMVRANDVTEHARKLKLILRVTRDNVAEELYGRGLNSRSLFTGH